MQKNAQIFDGKKIFAIVTGPRLDAPETVVKHLPADAQVIVVPNHKELRETYTLPLLLAKAFSLEPSDTVFYAHTKGLGWLGTALEAPTRWWSLSMYQGLFSQEAINLLKTHAFVGWMKSEGRAEQFPAESTWHFPGTFWWFRASEVYSRAWWKVPAERFGAEAYPSMIVGAESAGSLRSFPGDHICPPKLGNRLYGAAFWRQIGMPLGADAFSYEAPQR